MFKLKNVVVLLVVLFLVLGITLQVKATDSSISLDNLLQTSDTNTVDTTNTTTDNSIDTENTVNTVSGGSIIQSEENDTEGSSENDLPQTGVTEDITVMFFIVVCAISAIYAYKKIRDYKA